MANLFERLGGEAAVEAAVVRMYERLLADPLVGHYFANLDMDAQVRKQIGFVTMALGGPSTYTGRDLRVAHAKLEGLGDPHFDCVARHLFEVLIELGVDDATANEALQVVAATRPDVLNR